MPLFNGSELAPTPVGPGRGVEAPRSELPFGSPGGLSQGGAGFGRA